MKKLFLIVIILLLYACRKDFIIPQMNENPIVVSCFLLSGDTIKLRLSYSYDSWSGNLIDKEHSITNADVYIYEDNILKEKLKERVIYDEYGWYYSENFVPSEGHEYELKVFVSGYDSLYAKTYIPVSVKIDTIITSNKDIDQWGDTLVSLFINFTDNNLEENFYTFDMYSVLDNQIGLPHYQSNDPVIENRDNNGIFKSYGSNPDLIYFPYFSDVFFQNKNYSLKITHSISSNNKYYYNLFTISKDAYLYYQSTYLQHHNEDNPLIEPTVIYSNIENGIGIFAGMSLNTYSITF